ncbi:hypothetical protein AGMMS50239_12380 [Bacteroidia bacterium]|nr:hypothetical protein AGMMS50239_12380 [Bacteroidia bacterium]
MIIKKLLQLSILITLAFVFSNCNQSKKASDAKGEYVTIDAQNIDLDQTKEILLSDFVDTIDIIPLEFNDSCILREIRKIIIHGNNIFLIEAQRPSTVYRFDLQGNFLNLIGLKGQGPDEIVELKDFSINEKDSVVYLLDNARQTILSYNFAGQLIETLKMNQYANRLAYKDGFFYLFRDQQIIGDNLCSLIIRDTQGEAKNSFFPSKKYPISLEKQTFTDSKDGLFFCVPMNDTIYSLHGTDLNYAYFVDFGSLRFTPKEIKDIYLEKTTTIQTLLNNERLTSIDHLYQVGDWLYFNSAYKIFKFSFLYNTSGKTLKVAAQIYDDLEFMFYNNQFYGQTEDVLIGIYETYGLDKDIERYERYEKEKRVTKEKKEKQVQKMNAIKRGDNPEEMNPWILLYHIKR